MSDTSDAQGRDTRRETVIVVHGTFSGKDTESAHARPGWYAPGQTFASKLDAALAARGSPARCWAHLATGEDYFWWDGANDWLARFKAAARLRSHVRALHELGWTVHLVGHSHGGNVIVDAITNDAGRVEPWFQGRVALLGTPLYRPASTFGVRQRNRTLAWALATMLVWALLLTFVLRRIDPFAAFALGASSDLGATVAIAVLIAAGTVLLVKGGGWGLRNVRSVDLLFLGVRLQGTPPSQGEWRRSPAFMLVNSHYDEAYRSLTGLQEGDNPLIEEPPQALHSPPASRWFPLLSWPGRFVRKLAAHVAAVADTGARRVAARVGRTLRIDHGGALLAAGALLLLLAAVVTRGLALALASWPAATVSLVFWSALALIAVAACLFRGLALLPGIVLLEAPAAVWRALTGLAALQLEVPIRRGVWGFLRSLGMGLSGAPQRVQDTRVSLDRLDPEDCVYLELPEDLVAGVKTKQNGRLGDIQDILYRRGGTWYARNLVKELHDLGFPLVHTSYYDNAECIEKVADWLREPVIEEFDGHPKFMTTRMTGPAIGGLRAGYLEEVEGRNRYVMHVDELKSRHAAPGSRWGGATQLSFDASVIAAAAMTPKLPSRWRVPPPGPAVKSPYDRES